MATDVQTTRFPSHTFDNGATGRRLDFLSRPKTCLDGYEEDRRSIYWSTHVPYKSGPGGTTFVTSARQNELAQPKKRSISWIGDRASSMWPVSKAARKAIASPRILLLSQPKEISPYYSMARSPFMSVTKAALKGEASPRVIELAYPKPRVNIHDTYNLEHGAYHPLPPAVLQANISERVEKLSQPKDFPKEFCAPRPVMWPVSETAKNAVASLRIQQLCRPRSRTLIKDDYDPFKVSLAARQARPTPRIEELSQPLERRKK